VKNLKYIPTWKIIEILNEPYTRGVNGKDYEPVREELEAILWKRQTRNFEKNIEKEIEEYYEL
jgi:hypothetical protein